MNVEQWSQKVAALATDALVDAKAIDQDSVLRATEIIAKEIQARLNLGDFPAKTST